MSKTPVEKFEGLTLKLVVQQVDLTYHGAVIRTQANGILGAMVATAIGGSVSRAQAQTRTSVSCIMQQVAFADLGEHLNDVASKSRGLKSLLVGSNSDLNSRVKTYFDAVETAKKASLQGRDSIYLSSEELKRVKDSITPYNVGKVLKCKLQARIWSETEFPGSRKLADGGYSTVRVLYTWYVPYPEDGNIDAACATMQELYTSSEEYDECMCYKALAKVVDGNRVTISSVAPKPIVARRNEAGKLEKLTSDKAVCSTADRDRIRKLILTE